MAVLLQLVDPKTGAETPVVISEDDGIRVETTLESLGSLKPVFKKDGSTTAGNSSQVVPLAPPSQAISNDYWAPYKEPIAVSGSQPFSLSPH